MNQKTRRTADPEALGAVLTRLLTRSGVTQFLAYQKLCDCWRQVVEPSLARHTRLVGLRGKVLRVDVDSAAHRQELVMFHKNAILEQLRAAGTPFLILDIDFRIGSF